MTTRVLSAPARTRPGATLLLDDAPHLVLHLPGRALAARLTADPPCRLCEAPLQWAPPARRWECPECADVPTTEQLADWAREHVRDGVRAGRARRGRAPGVVDQSIDAETALIQESLLPALLEFVAAAADEPAQPTEPGRLEWDA